MSLSEEDRDTLGEHGCVMVEAEFGMMHLHSKDVKECQQTPEARRGKEGFSSIVRERMVLLITLFGNSSFQNHETISFYCFKPSRFRFFVMEALGNLSLC